MPMTPTGQWRQDNTLVLTPAQVAEFSERARVKAAINITTDPEARRRVEAIYGKEFCMDRWPEAYGRENTGGPMRLFKQAVQTVKSLIPVLLMAAMIFATIPAITVPALADTTTPGTWRAPTIYKGAVTTKIYWTAGTVYNGGHTVAVAAGSANLTTNMNNCSAPGYSACNFLYVNSSGTVAVATALATAFASGNTLLAMVETGAADAIATNIVLPQQSGALWSQTAGDVLTGSDTVLATAQFDATSGSTGTTLTNVTGMVVTVVPGTYYYRVHAPGVSTSNSGIKCAFKYTNTVVGTFEAIGIGHTASAVAVQHTTTAADQTVLFAQTAAVIDVVVEGVMVVTTGGTVQFQAAQNASHGDTTSVYARATMTFKRIS